MRGTKRVSWHDVHEYNDRPIFHGYRRDAFPKYYSPEELFYKSARELVRHTGPAIRISLITVRPPHSHLVPL